MQCQYILIFVYTRLKKNKRQTKYRPRISLYHYNIVLETTNQLFQKKEDIHKMFINIKKVILEMCNINHKNKK